MTRPVRRKRVKVIGLLLFLVMLALWFFSVIYLSSYVPPSRQWAITIGYGRVSPSAIAELQIVVTGWTFSPFYSQLKAATADMSATEFAQFHLGFCLPGKYYRRTVPSGYYAPVWLLVVATGFPTAVLWWRDRRPRAGFCKVCKYNLTGNVSGRCPECGTAVSPETS